MPKGSPARKSEVDALMEKIKQCRSKWGTGYSQTFYPTAGATIVKSEDINNMVTWTQDVKNRSGWTGSLPAKVNVGQIMTDIVSTLSSANDSIKNHCKCNCNYCSCNCNKCNCNCNDCSDCNNS